MTTSGNSVLGSSGQAEADAEQDHTKEKTMSYRFDVHDIHPRRRDY